MGLNLAEIDIAMVTLILIALIFNVIVWKIFDRQRALAELVQDQPYQTLAERAIETERMIADELSDISTRVARIERELKEVD